MQTRTALTGAIVALSMSATAGAQTLATFSFSDLEGSFNAGAGVFRATGQAASSGDFSRTGDGTADWNPGTLSSAGFNSVELEITVLAINNVARTATGTGFVTITDDDGDAFTGTFSGDWLGTGIGFTFLSSTGIDFAFDSSGGDGVFEGGSGGSFTSFPDADTFLGAVSLLFLQPAGSNFFQSSFRTTETQADGVIIVPAPGAVALLGLSGLAVARRRRG